MNDSFVFYNSFLEAIEMLPSSEEKLKAYEALAKYALKGEIPTENSIVFIMAKPQIDANSTKRKNGCKGGRPPLETSGYVNEKPMVIEKKNQTSQNEKPNVNVNANENVNLNANVNVNDIANGLDLSQIQRHYVLSASAINEIRELSEKLPFDMINLAFEIGIDQDKRTFAYVRKIMNEWVINGIDTREKYYENEKKRNKSSPQQRKVGSVYETCSVEEAMEDYKKRKAADYG